MDDFVISNLHESRNEWCSRLVSIFTPLVIEGIRSIFNESWKLCQETDEINKYLMTFQNLLSRIPKWNSIIVEEERGRIGGNGQILLRHRIDRRGESRAVPARSKS